jgi:hypothetical protein
MGAKRTPQTRAAAGNANAITPHRASMRDAAIFGGSFEQILSPATGPCRSP